MEYSSAGDQDALFGLAASYLRTAINDRGGEWRATFVIGDEPALLSDYYQPFGERGLYFFAPSLNFQSSIFNVWEDDIRVTEAQIREGELELGIGRELPSWAEYRFGVRAAYGAGVARRRASARGGLPARRVVRPVLRRHDGQRLVPALGDACEHGMARVAFGSCTPTSISIRCCSRWRTRRRGAGTRCSRRFVTTRPSAGCPLDRLFRAGGFFDISGLNRNQLSGQHVARVGAAWYRRIGDLALFPAFAGVSMELGNVFESRSDISIESSILGGSFWAGVRTPVGPVYVAIGRAEGGESAFYVFLGRIF